jgi:diguanylate cyclase (GGDEF)-like protein
VARLGGDEFVVLLEELSEQDAEARIQTASIGQKILDAINLPYDLAGHRHHSTPSIGATLFNNQQHTVEELIKQADLAMYQVKASGRNALRFFEPVPTPAAGAGPV